MNFLRQVQTNEKKCIHWSDTQIVCIHRFYWVDIVANFNLELNSPKRIGNISFPPFYVIHLTLMNHCKYTHTHTRCYEQTCVQREQWSKCVALRAHSNTHTMPMRCCLNTLQRFSFSFFSHLISHKTIRPDKHTHTQQWWWWNIRARIMIRYVKNRYLMQHNSCCGIASKKQRRFVSEQKNDLFLLYFVCFKVQNEPKKHV